MPHGCGVEIRICHGNDDAKPNKPNNDSKAQPFLFFSSCQKHCVPSFDHNLLFPNQHLRGGFLAVLVHSQAASEFE